MVRGWFGRVKARRARYRRKLLADQNYAATVIQSSYRALKGRRRYAKMLLRKFLKDQEERRLGVKKRRAARMMQGTWKTYLARVEAERIKEELRQARLLLMRKIAAAMHLQRIFRGHMARKLRRVLEAQMRLMIRQNRATVVIQCAVRQRQAWLEAKRRRWAREMAKRNKYVHQNRTEFLIGTLSRYCRGHGFLQSCH
jgi:IQ calmodulin-binding motif